MLQTSSSGVSLVAPNETAKTLYCSLSEINGEKNQHCRIPFYINPGLGHIFAKHITLCVVS